MELSSTLLNFKNISVITRYVIQETSDTEATLSTAPAPEFNASAVNVIRAVLNVINTLTHFCLGSVVLSAFTIAISAPVVGNHDSSYSFSQHIYLCVTGYIILLAQSILSFDPVSGWARGLKSPHKRGVHGVMHVVGSILALTGCLIKLTDSTPKTISPWHLITGCCAMGLTFLSLVGGVLNYNIHKARFPHFKRMHTNLTLLILLFAFLSLYFAFNDRDHMYHVYDNASAILSKSFTIIAFAGILISAACMKLK